MNKLSTSIIFFGLILFFESTSIFGQGADFYQRPDFRDHPNIKNDLLWASRFIFHRKVSCNIVFLLIIGGTINSFRDRIQRENDPSRPIR